MIQKSLAFSSGYFAKKSMIAFRLSWAVEVSVCWQPSAVSQYEKPTPAGDSMNKLLVMLFHENGFCSR